MKEFINLAGCLLRDPLTMFSFRKWYFATFTLSSRQTNVKYMTYCIKTCLFCLFSFFVIYKCIYKISMYKARKITEANKAYVKGFRGVP